MDNAKCFIPMFCIKTFPFVNTHYENLPTDIITRRPLFLTVLVYLFLVFLFQSPHELLNAISIAFPIRIV